MPNGTGISRNFQISEKKDNLWRLSKIFEMCFQKRSVPFDFVPEFPEILVQWIAPHVSSCECQWSISLTGLKKCRGGQAGTLFFWFICYYIRGGLHGKNQSFEILIFFYKLTTVLIVHCLYATIINLRILDTAMMVSPAVNSKDFGICPLMTPTFWRRASKLFLYSFNKGTVAPLYSVTLTRFSGSTVMT